MFKIDADPAFWATVTVRTPGAEPSTFKARFRAMEISRFKALDLSDPDDVRAFIAQTLRDLNDIEGADGKPVGFSDELRDRLADMPLVRAALVRGYVEAISDAATGN